MSKPRGAKRSARRPERPLSLRAQQFVIEYLVDLNATRACIRAGYSERTAAEQGTRLLKDPRVKAAIDKAMAERAARTKVSADRVVEEFWSIATANMNEIVEFRRTCCRHCHGTNFEPQHTKGEQASRRAIFALRKNPLPTDVFDEQGGEGFDARRDPHPNCPECFGEGVGAPFFKDTRHLGADSVRLYGGVKITKDGIEIKAHDKLGALSQLGRHFGLFREKGDDADDVSEEELEQRLLALVRTAVARKKASEGVAA